MPFSNSANSKTYSFFFFSFIKRKAKGKKLTDEVLEELPGNIWGSISVSDDDNTDDKVHQILETLNRQIDLIHNVFEDKIQKLKRGDDLPPGVIKMVKIYISIKRKLQVGDKKKVISAGDGFYIPPHIYHGAVCLEPGELIDVFSPIREDFFETKKNFVLDYLPKLQASGSLRSSYQYEYVAGCGE